MKSWKWWLVSFFYLGKSLHAEVILINVHDCSSLDSQPPQHAAVWSVLHSLSDQHSMATLSHPSSDCTSLQGDEPFFPHSSAAKTQTNTALQQIIKLLPSQHSSFQASRGTLQGFFLKYKSRICAILGITATSGGLGPGFIVHVHRNILCSLLCCLNIWSGAWFTKNRWYKCILI